MAFRRHTTPRGRTEKQRRRKISGAPRQERGIYAASPTDPSSATNYKLTVPIPQKRRHTSRAPAGFAKHRSARRGHPRLQFHWSESISQSEWATYRLAIRAVRDAGIPFLLGGGFAGATFTGRWRDTKDIDFYVHPQDRQATVAALAKAGFEDYFSRLQYDRKWIYRSTRSGMIVDIIWAMANQRAQVDHLWFERAGKVEIRGEKLCVIPMEEFLWCKLYIMQRDHCDWPDIFNLLYKHGPRLDWEHLLKRLDRDTRLLKAILMMFSWLCPAAARRLSASLWRRLKLRPEIPPLRRGEDRVHLLDSRGWFGPMQPVGHKLEV
jgi:hypothetical protein